MSRYQAASLQCGFVKTVTSVCGPRVPGAVETVRVSAEQSAFVIKSRKNEKNGLRRNRRFGKEIPAMSKLKHSRKRF